MLKSFYVHTDVTCIEIINEQIFAGIGGDIKIFTLQNEFKKKIKIFEDQQQVFGIKSNSTCSKLIIYGGKSIAIFKFVQLNDNNVELQRINTDLPQFQLSDWILDIKWIENDKKFVTSFMHNKITLWDENMKIELSVKCEERCILYSAHLCYETFEQLTVLSGTVFSEILIWKPFYKIGTESLLSPVLKRLQQHKGVIFNIHYNLKSNFICSVSDDRSAILWKLSSSELLKNLNPTNCDEKEIIVKVCQVYGHLSRVFRCVVLQNYFLTCGEDSLLIIWNFDGTMQRKIDTHQGGAIWSICVNSEENKIFTGGNDGAILTLNLNPTFHNNSISLPDNDNPKIVALLQDCNSLICLTEKANLNHYSIITRKWENIANFPDLLKYNILQLSPCRKLIALAGIAGQIYIYNSAIKSFQKYRIANNSRIFSFHWLNCKMFLASQKDGIIKFYFIQNDSIIFIQDFILPPSSKDRFPTCALLYYNGHFIIGDRKGNIHNFKFGLKNPINSIKRAHSHLGVTHLNYHQKNNKCLISLGRDGIIKKYILEDDKREILKCIETTKTQFSWLTMQDKKSLVSFSGTNFLISDLKFHRILFEANCGGGHRSWDYLNNYSDNNSTFTYIKQKKINLINFNLNDFTPVNVLEGYHVKEINCLKTFIINEYQFLLSGGEDTIFRISVLNGNNELQVLESLKVHLSSIRALNAIELIKNLQENFYEYMLITAGGRGQIITWKLFIKLTNNTLNVSCSEQYNFYEPLLDENEGEIRIMDLCTVNYCKNEKVLFAGCSDGSVKIFFIQKDYQLTYLRSIQDSKNSICKLAQLELISEKLLGTMGTNGYLKFWSLNKFLTDQKIIEIENFKLHQSGINSCDFLMKNDQIWFLSGGDDNSINLALFMLHKTEEILKITMLKTYTNSFIHCAQITGSYLTDHYVITSAIDQRIVISKWSFRNNQIDFKLLSQNNTTIADPQGLERAKCSNNLKFCIYGNGIECFQLLMNENKSVFL